jgi:hypothetical protein
LRERAGGEKKSFVDKKKRSQIKKKEKEKQKE